MQIWGTATEQSIYYLFAIASARAQQDVSCKIAQQLSASAVLGAAQWLVVQQQQQQQQHQQHHQHHPTHMHTHTSTNCGQKLKINFHFYFVNFATYCFWRRSNSIASGWVSLTQIVQPLHESCFGLASILAKSTIYLSLKLRKLCF